MVGNFRWQIPGKLAGMAYPQLDWGDEDSADATFLAEQGVTAIVSLTPRPLSKTVLKRHGFDHLHLPVEDMTAPTMDQMAAFVDWVRGRVAGGGRVAVHCRSGVGRTGTMLAAYLVSLGSSAGEAIREVRGLSRAAIETQSQELAVYEWAEVWQRRQAGT